MHAEILKKEQEEKWDKFAHTHPHSSIHQTSNWAHFQSNVPARDKFWIIAIYEDDNPKKKIIGGTLLIKHRLPKSKYCWLYSPRGPLLSYEKSRIAKKQLKALTSQIKKIAKAEKAIFYRADPPIHRTKKNKHQLKFPGFYYSHLGFQPEDTLILDLEHPHQTILKRMKSKGRYNIRLAKKKGVKIIEVAPPVLRAKKETVDLIRQFQSEIDGYFNLLQETLERDKFYGHSISFYKNMIEKLAPDADPHDPTTPTPTSKTSLKKALKNGFAKLYLAEYTPKETHTTQYIAGIIVTFYKHTAIYYYGASGNEHRNVMAPYLLQWHAIQEAKSLGCKHYDFLGIAPPTRRDSLGPKGHPWRGVTEFKHKFGGEHVAYLPAQELIFSPFLYLLYRIVRHFRKTFKNLRRGS